MTARRAFPLPPFGTLAELEQLAQNATRKDVWEYVETGAGEGWTQHANHDGFGRWALAPRVLRGLAEVDLRTTLLGRRVDAPIFAAPSAYHGAVHRDAELATARASARAGILGVYSTLSSRSVEEIGRAAGRGARWFQLYLQPGSEASIALARRAAEAGFTGLVVTVDAPILGPRDLQSHGGFAIVGREPLGNGADVRTPARTLTRSEGRYRLEGVGEHSWAAVEKVRDAAGLPLVVKGILRPEDAVAAVEHGARGIIVSNHGGRQLDRAVPAIAALPGIVDAVGGRAEVYLDGGVRRASDALIALALGAKAVGLGRPVLWALAVGGGSGLDRLFDLFTAELATSLLLLGRASVGELDRSDVVPMSADGSELPTSRSSPSRRARRTHRGAD